MALPFRIFSRSTVYEAYACTAPRTIDQQTAVFTHNAVAPPGPVPSGITPKMLVHSVQVTEGMMTG